MHWLLRMKLKDTCPVTPSNIQLTKKKLKLNGMQKLWQKNLPSTLINNYVTLKEFISNAEKSDLEYSVKIRNLKHESNDDDESGLESLGNSDFPYATISVGTVYGPKVG